MVVALLFPILVFITEWTFTKNPLQLSLQTKKAFWDFSEEVGHIPEGGLAVYQPRSLMQATELNSGWFRQKNNSLKGYWAGPRISRKAGEAGLQVGTKLKPRCRTGLVRNPLQLLRALHLQLSSLAPCRHLCLAVNGSAAWDSLSGSLILCL